MSKNSLVNIPSQHIKATLGLLAEHGVRPDHLTRARQPEGQVRLKRAAQALKGWRYSDSISWQEARGIMKPGNFFGPAQWRDFFGITFPKEVMEQIEEFPWSADVLQHRCSDFQHEGNFMYLMDHEHYFAFLGIDRWLDGDPLTILKWYQILQQRIQEGAPGPVLTANYSTYAGWLEIRDGYAEKESPSESHRQVATETTPKFGWYLMRIADAQGPWRSEELHRPVELLMPSHQTATAVERISMYIFYYLLNSAYSKLQGGYGGVCADTPREPGKSGHLLPRPEVSVNERGIKVGDDRFFDYELDRRHYPLIRIPGQ